MANDLKCIYMYIFKLKLYEESTIKLNVSFCPSYFGAHCVFSLILLLHSKLLGPEPCYCYALNCVKNQLAKYFCLGLLFFFKQGNI